LPDTPDLLLVGGDVLLHDGEWRVERTDVTVRDGLIAHVGKGNGETGKGKGPHPHAQIRDCRGCLIMPGLIQAHVHLCQTLFRGLADGLRLEDWLVRRIWPLEAAHTEETVYWSALLGAAELLLGGTTAILDMETVRHTTGLEEIAYLDSVGIAGPRAALAHCVWVDAHETARLARQGTTVVHCPSSNLKLASGVAKVPELLAAGCRVALGADGAPCNNRLDAFAEMRLAALIQKPRLGADALPAGRVLALATLGGARALGLETEIGSIAPGKRADLVVLDLREPHLHPAGGDPVSLVVYAACASDVRDVFVDGRPLGRDRLAGRRGVRPVARHAGVRRRRHAGADPRRGALRTLTVR